MDQHSEEDISLKELILKFKEWVVYLKLMWKILVISGIVGVMLGIGYSYFKKPIYTANLTFALEEKTAGGTSGLSSIASSFGFSFGGGEGGAFAGDNIIELMKSRLMIEKTLLTKVEINEQEDLLINRFITFNKLNVNLTKVHGVMNSKFNSDRRESFTRAQDSVLGEIQNGILKSNLEVAKIDKKLSVISVKVNSSDEIFAKLFCENLVKNVTNFYVQTKIGKSRKNISLLESRVDSVKKELDLAMYGRASFADQNMGLIRQSAAVPKLKQELRVQMLGTLYGELVKNLELSKLTLMREEPLIQQIDYPILPLYKEKIGVIHASLYGGLISLLLSIAFLTIFKIYKTLV